jgi:hypothetical protein
MMEGEARDRWLALAVGIGLSLGPIIVITALPISGRARIIASGIWLVYLFTIRHIWIPAAVSFAYGGRLVSGGHDSERRWVH